VILLHPNILILENYSIILKKIRWKTDENLERKFQLSRRKCFFPRKQQDSRNSPGNIDDPGKQPASV
jgi:hypothetical protein